jgi:hypothetical protein
VEFIGHFTALHLACGFAHLDTIRLLAKRGVNTDNFTVDDMEFELGVSKNRQEKVKALHRALIPSLS